MKTRFTRRSVLLGTAISTAAARAGGDASIRMIFGGDVIFARGVAARIAKNNGESPFVQIQALLQAADIAFVNLESPFSDGPPITTAEMVFRAAPEHIRALVNAGIDIVSTANNHVRDCGPNGIAFTLDLLQRNRIVAVGTGKDEAAAYGGAVLERNGVKFGFLAYTFDQANGNHRDQDPRVAMLDVPKMRSSVASLRSRCDTVIVSMHAGAEYVSRPYAQQIEFARAAIDAGAQLVVGHHPHVVQTLELYRGGLILYSLGNLVFDQNQPDTRRGLLAEAVFRGSKLTECKLIPVDIVDTVPRVAPKPAPSTILL